MDPAVPSNSPPRTRTPLTPAAASASTGDTSTSTSTWVTNPVPEPISNNINTSIKLNTHNIPPQFLSGGGGGGENSSANFGSSSAGAGADNSPTTSPRGAFASNYSLKSELENIRLEDHCFVDGGARSDPDDYPDPDNINLGSLMARMRQIRSSGQIQYRIPKKRRREDEPKTCREGEEEELETITIQRQKRVRKNPRGPRSERDKARKKKNETRNETRNETGNETRNWLLRPACHPPMVLETVPEVEMEVAPELDNVRSGGGETGDEGTNTPGQQTLSIFDSSFPSPYIPVCRVFARVSKDYLMLLAFSFVLSLMDIITSTQIRFKFLLIAPPFLSFYFLSLFFLVWV